MNQHFRPLHQFQVVRFFSLIMLYGNNHLRLQSPVMSDWSGHAQQQEASLPFFFPHRQCGWPCSVIPQGTKASSDAGPELAGSGSHKAMESPKALMCPLEKGVRGIETGLQMPAEEQRSGGHALWCEAVLLATMNLITVKSWLKMLSLSVSRWDFTDKLGTVGKC